MLTRVASCLPRAGRRAGAADGSWRCCQRTMLRSMLLVGQRGADALDGAIVAPCGARFACVMWMYIPSIRSAQIKRCWTAINERVSTPQCVARSLGRARKDKVSASSPSVSASHYSALTAHPSRPSARRFAPMHSLSSSMRPWARYAPRCASALCSARPPPRSSTTAGGASHIERSPAPQAALPAAPARCGAPRPQIRLPPGPLAQMPRQLRRAAHHRGPAAAARPGAGGRGLQARGAHPGRAAVSGLRGDPCDPRAGQLSGSPFKAAQCTRCRHWRVRACCS